MEKWQLDHMIEMLEMDFNSTETLESEYAQLLTEETNKGNTEGMFFWKRQIENERDKRRMLQRHIDRVKRWKRESEQSAKIPAAL